MKTAAAYIRVSDERQEEFSPDSQLKLIREYCHKNDIELPDELIFCDDGISAKTTKKREQFNNMIALAKLKDRPFDMILVWKYSRFARNQEESIVYKSLLRKNGVEVISISEPLSDNPFGGLIERIIEWMDEYYLIRLSDEVRRGMTERATRGLPNTAPPFGYRMIDGEYRVHEEEAATVRKIFNMFIDGRSMRSISVYLGNIGVRNRYNNPLDSRAIEYILNNPCYIGYVRWNPNGRSASKRIYDNPEDIVRKSSHPSIVDEETFKKAKELIKLRKKNNQKYGREEKTIHEFALRGLVRCDTCGSTLTYAKAYKSLQCHRYGKGLCQVSHSIKLDHITNMVIQAMKKAVNELSFNVETEHRSSQARSNNDYEKLIKQQELKLERAKNAYQEGADSLNEYKTSKNKILKQIEEYKKAMLQDRSEAQGIDLKDFADTVTEVISLVENPEISPDLKNKAMKTVLTKVVYFKTENRIELYFNI